MYKSFLSWRLLLQRRINLIGIFGILIGVGALILILSIMSGFLEQSRKTLRGALSDVIVSPVDLGRPDGRRIPTDPSGILEVVRADPRVEAAAPHLVWYGYLIEDELSAERLKSSRFGMDSIVQLVGIDLEDEFTATDLRDSLTRPPADPELAQFIQQNPDADSRVDDPDDPFVVDESLLPAGDALGIDKRGVVIGAQLARHLRLYKGDTITLATGFPDQDSSGLSFHNYEFVITGTFRSQDNELDLERVYLDRWDLMDLLGDQLEFSEVLVKLHDYDASVDTIVDDLYADLDEAGLISGVRLERSGRPGEVQTWEQYRGALLGAIENERVLMAIMLSLVLLVAGFTVFAILSMMVTEKTRDIGILTALGATPRGVMQLFLNIALWNALIGATLGAVLGVWGAIKIDPIERWLSSTLGVEIFDRNVYLFDHIPSRVQPLWVGTIVLGAFVCTLLFAALPAWRAARIDPLSALRYE